MGALKGIIKKLQEVKLAKIQEERLRIKANAESEKTKERERELKAREYKLYEEKDKFEAYRVADKILDTIDAVGNTVSKQFTAFSDHDNVIAGNCYVDGKQYFYTIYEDNIIGKQRYNMIIGRDDGIQEISDGDHYLTFTNERVLRVNELVLNKNMKISEVSSGTQCDSSDHIHASDIRIFDVVRKTEQLLNNAEQTDINEK